jgi:hypothetical protein
MPKLTFLSGRGFDAGLAALAAVSAGFVLFAMPGALFTSLVETSRLPDLVAAAQPPLGETARLAAVGTAALLAFAAVWALMGALDRLTAPRTAAEPEPEAPRLRRADAHPDAPARRPLLARDLGEPLDLGDFVEAEKPPLAEAELRPLPAFLVAQPPEPEPEPEPVAQAEPEAEPYSEAEAEAEPLSISELAAQLPEAEEEEDDQSLSQLVNRIEFGLSRKRQSLPMAELPTASEEIPAEQERVGHRLRSAINDLQKIAGGTTAA